MIPALKKQIDSANRRTTAVSRMPFAEANSFSVEYSLGSNKTSVRHLSQFPKHGQQSSSSKAVSNKPKGDKGGDPVTGPRRSWYGNYTGPGNERNDWEEEHLPPMTPLDRGPMQHDQEYSNLEEQYGYGDGSFYKMRLDTEHPFIHTSLIESDARLMWRSAWYPVEGLANGEYDLTFSKGTRGVTNLFTDSLAAGVIHGVFPLLMGVDAAFFGIAATRQLGESVGSSFRNMGGLGASSVWKNAFASPAYWGPGDFYPDWDKELDYWRKRLEVEFWKYKPFPNATTGWKGDFFGYGYWEIGMRNTTMLDIAVFAISLAVGPAGPITWMARGGISWAAIAAYGLWKLGEKVIGDWLERGLEGAIRIGNVGSLLGNNLFSSTRDRIDISRHFEAIGSSAASGWKRSGRAVSSEWKRAGGRASDAWKQAGRDISTGWKSAGGKLSDTWKNTTGGGGGCFLTTAAVRSLSSETGERVLATLRAFRDGCLLASDQGRELVGAYYTIAPQIVDRIDASSAPAGEYERIYHEIVLPCHQFILSGDSEAAIGIYSRGVCDLAAKWLAATSDYRDAQ